MMITYYADSQSLKQGMLIKTGNLVFGFKTKIRFSVLEFSSGWPSKGLSLWNQVLPSMRSTLLTGEPSASFLSRLLSSLWVSRTGSASDWCALQEALYKCIDTIQYCPHKKEQRICRNRLLR